MLLGLVYAGLSAVRIFAVAMRFAGAMIARWLYSASCLAGWPCAFTRSLILARSGGNPVSIRLRVLESYELSRRFMVSATEFLR